MSKLILLTKPLKFSSFLFFYILLFTVNSSKIYGQCYSATYNIVSDYSNEDLPLKMKKQFIKESMENKIIYEMVQSSSRSLELVDSIAHICGGASIILKPEIIIRQIGQETVDLYYNSKKGKTGFFVQNPNYLDCWQKIEPIMYKKTENRYFKATKGDSNDYVIFDSNIPVFFNLKLINGISGLVVEAVIGVNHIKLQDFKTVSCSMFSHRIEQYENIEKQQVKRIKSINFSEFLNPFSDLIESENFECVKSF